ncbi:unnamed protein product [Sphagnum jensenii]|uniref:Acyl-CoA-binding domain-containing protein n=1 Tax=Sphagnum jensenii TaxID=128206 RepID=A0ABP1ACS6_9BRYO
MVDGKQQPEEDPSWWSKAQELDKEVTLDTEISKPPPPVADSEPMAQEEMDNEKLVMEVELNEEDKVEDTPMVVVPSASNHILKVNGIFSTEDVEDVAERIRAIAVYNEWVSPTVTDQNLDLQHAAGVVDNKMYVIGGNHNAHYLNDVQVLDLKTLEWSKVDKVPQSPLSLQQKQSPYRFPPCAGHSLVCGLHGLVGHKAACHSKEPVDTVIVCAFDTHTVTWTILDVYGKSPMVWSKPQTQGTVLSPCARHAGATIGISDTLILNMDTVVWSLVASVKGQTAISSEVSIVLLMLDPEEPVSESVQENFNVEQLREEPECALDNSATSKKLALALKVNEELQEATLAAQAECSKLQMDVAELRQKLQCMEILQWELDLLQCQKDASKEAVIQAAQKQGTGVWSWLAGSPPDSDRVED